MKRSLYKTHNAITLNQQLDRWTAMQGENTRFHMDEYWLTLALPETASDFAPSVPELDCLLKSLGVSVSILLQAIGTNYATWQTTKCRFVKKLNEINAEGAEIHANGQVNLIPQWQAKRDKLFSPATNIVNYEGWLKLLGLVGLLDRDVLARYRLRKASYHKRLQSLSDAYAELLGHAPIKTEQREEEAFTLPPSRNPYHSDSVAFAEPPDAVRDSVANLVAVHLSTGGVQIEDGSYNAVSQGKIINDTELHELVTRGACAVLVGYHIRGEIMTSLRGVLIVNCMFTGVVFKGPADGATFIGCDFGGDCVFRGVKEQNNLTFHSCTTPDGPLRMSNLTLTGIRFIECNGMRIRAARSSMKDSQFINGWVLSERTAAGDNLPGQRVAPRSMSGTRWRNGGFDFDMQHPDSGDGYKEPIASVVPQITAPRVQHGIVKAPDGKEWDSGAELVASLLRSGKHTTRQVAHTQWEVTLERRTATLFEQALAQAQQQRARAPRPGAEIATSSADGDQGEGQE